MVEELHEQDCEELRLRPKEKCTRVHPKVQAKKHRTEWCAAASKYRCMRCGRGSKKAEDARNMRVLKVV